MTTVSRSVSRTERAPSAPRYSAIAGPECPMGRHRGHEVAGTVPAPIHPGRVSQPRISELCGVTRARGMVLQDAYAGSARPPGARVRRTPATATEGPSVFGAQRSHGAPRGQAWLQVSEPLVLNSVFDSAKKNRKPGLSPPSHRGPPSLPPRGDNIHGT
jgi:hypothetical protein